MKKILFILSILISILFASRVPAFSQTEKQIDAFSGVTTGTTTTTYSVSIPAITIPTYDGQKIWVKFNTTNTGASTLRVNTYTARAITLNGGALTAGKIIANQYVGLVYNTTTTSWQLQAPSAAAASTFWDLSGNAGTTAGTNFVGTTDDIDVVFKRNSVQSGLLNDALFNTSWGVLALKPTTSGSQNTAIGFNSATNNTTGSGNTSVGSASFQSNTTGKNNTAIGQQTLNFNVSASSNVALGFHSGYLSTGSRNVFLGDSAGYSWTGDDALFIGNSTDPYMIHGDFSTGNVGIGTGTVTPTATLHVASTYTTSANFIQKNFNGNNVDMFNLRGDKFVGFGVEAPQLYDFSGGGEFSVKLGRLHAEFLDGTTGKGLLINSFNEPYEATAMTTISASNAYRNRQFVLTDVGQTMLGGAWSSTAPSTLKFGVELNWAVTGNSEEFGLFSHDTLANSGIKQTYYMATNGVSAAPHEVAEYNVLKRIQSNYTNNKTTYFQWKSWGTVAGALVERMRIDTSGNVGIGTGSVTPTTTLDINGGITIEPLATQTLTAASTTVTVGNESYIKVTSDDATPANRLLVLPQSTSAGQILMIEFVGATYALKITDDAAQGTGGNMRLAGDMDMNQYDTITLISNGTDWIETSRSVN